MARTEKEFNLFWSLLIGRKVDKKKAKIEFLKIDTDISAEELASKFNNLYKITGNERFVPHPQRLLRNERWNDEISENINGEKVYRDSDGFIISKEDSTLPLLLLHFNLSYLKPILDLNFSGTSEIALSTPYELLIKICLALYKLL